MTGEEQYLGGFASGNLSVSGFPGNGIHITSRRVIFVRSRASSIMLGGLFGGAALGLLGTRSGKLSGKFSSRKIHQLDKEKYLEFLKEEIASLELKVVRESRWSRLLVRPKSGEPFEIDITAVRDYEIVKDLMNSFYPEALRIV